jgi:hypothetical protein
MGYLSVGTVKCDKQMANAYILYMMAGSLFDKARFINTIIEGNLYNQYKELTKVKQEQQEAYTEKMLKQLLGEYIIAFSQMRTDIYVKKQDGYYFFWFRTGFEEMIAAVDRNGRISIDKVYQLTRAEWYRLYMN